MMTWANDKLEKSIAKVVLLFAGRIFITLYTKLD